jgi:MFS superfamily sulfate permease-like transporter
MTRTQTYKYQELIGQGVGNLVADLCGGIPSSGATMGTVINAQVGAKTALAGLIRGTLMLVVVLWLADLAENIPMAVLAGIALSVGIEMLDWNVKNCDILVVDLSDVTYLNETAALAIKTAVQDSKEKGSKVFIVGAVGRVKQLLENLGILDLIPYEHLFIERTEALKRAVVVDRVEIGLQTG